MARLSIGSSGTVFLVCEYVTTTNPVLPVSLDIEYHGHILPCLVPSCRKDEMILASGEIANRANLLYVTVSIMLAVQGISGTL